MFRSFVRGNKNFHCWHPVVKFEVIAQSWCFYRLPFIGFLFGTLIDDLFKAVVGNNHMSACLEERVRCRARPSGGINTHSHPHTLTELRRERIYLHSHLSTWLQQWSTEITSIAGCLHTVILPPDWSWRGNVHNCTDVMFQSGEG